MDKSLQKLENLFKPHLLDALCGKKVNYFTAVAGTMQIEWHIKMCITNMLMKMPKGSIKQYKFIEPSFLQAERSLVTDIGSMTAL